MKTEDFKNKKIGELSLYEFALYQKELMLEMIDDEDYFKAIEKLGDKVIEKKKAEVDRIFCKEENPFSPTERKSMIDSTLIKLKELTDKINQLNEKNAPKKEIDRYLFQLILLNTAINKLVR